MRLDLQQIAGQHASIARSEVQMGTGNEFLNFNLIKKDHTKDHVKISHFAKFEVV